MRALLFTSLLAVVAFGQEVDTSPRVFPPLTTTTLAALTPVAGMQIIEINNGASATDCTTGGGSFRVKCWYDGSAWVSIGSGSSSATFKETYQMVCDNLDTVLKHPQMIAWDRDKVTCIPGSTGPFGYKESTIKIDSGTSSAWVGIRTTFPSGTVTDFTVRVWGWSGSTGSVSQTVGPIQKVCQATGANYQSGTFSGGSSSSAIASHTAGNMEAYVVTGISTSGCQAGGPLMVKINFPNVAQDFHFVVATLEFTK